MAGVKEDKKKDNPLGDKTGQKSTGKLAPAEIVSAPVENETPPPPMRSDVPINRILIIGISGYIGSSLAMGLRDSFEIFGTYHQRSIRMEGTTTFPMNAMNSNEVVDAIRRTQPDAIIYAAGISDPDTAQKDKDKTDSLHVKAPSIVLKTSIRPAHFIYFSTDQVFGDVPETVTLPIEENVPTSPINTIGTSKAQAETMVLSNRKGAHVLRLGPLYGEPFGSPHGFRRTWIDGLRRRIERREPLFLPRAQIRSHLYVGEFVRATSAFLKNIPSDSSIYNIAPRNAYSLYDFSKLFVDIMGYPEDSVRRSEKEDTLSNVVKAKNSSLKCKKFESHFGLEFQTIENALKEFAERLTQGHTKPWP
jgi:dTDP-4-dehydrorhamnose reductase